MQVKDMMLASTRGRLELCRCDLHPGGRERASKAIRQRAAGAKPPRRPSPSSPREPPPYARCQPLPILPASRRAIHGTLSAGAVGLREERVLHASDAIGRWPRGSLFRRHQSCESNRVHAIGSRWKESIPEAMETPNQRPNRVAHQG